MAHAGPRLGLDVAVGEANCLARIARIETGVCFDSGSRFCGNGAIAGQLDPGSADAGRVTPAVWGLDPAELGRRAVCDPGAAVSRKQLERNRDGEGRPRTHPIGSLPVGATSYLLRPAARLGGS